MTVTIEEAQASLKDLIERTKQGEKVLITRDNQPVAEIISVRAERPTPIFGFAKGMLTIVSDDDDHLEDFKEYMP